MRGLVAGLVLVATAGTAWANGRTPQAIGLHLRPGSNNDLVLAATFGALVSEDNGDTWRWLCETSIGYGGTFDPDYAITPSGTVLATTFDGVEVKRDACTFQLSPFGEARASAITVGPDGTVFYALSFDGDPFAVPPLAADYKIYRSTNDGTSFDAGTTAGIGGEWWQTIEVAPSDPQRVYLTGYRLDGANAKIRLLYRSIDGGGSFTPLAVDTFGVTTKSDLEIAAISPTDPQRVLLRVTWWSAVVGDAFYLTTNGGDSWTQVLQLNDTARGVLYRGNGDAVIATSASGVYTSTTGGASFTMLSTPEPGIGCLVERANGELWACTDDYAQPPFEYGVMKTTDLMTWTGVMRFEDDIVGPVDCAVGTIQQDCCTVHTTACPFQITPSWCFLRDQLGITAMPFSCAVPDAGAVVDPPKGGCCDAGTQPAGAGLLTLLVAFGLTRRPRYRGVRTSR